MTGNEWDPDSYDQEHAFVYERGAGVVDLLDPQPGERILDLGCGTGHLTHRIAEHGADVLGIDADPAMIRQAREAYPDLDFRQGDAREVRIDGTVDAVFSNAALHWIPGEDHDAVLDSVRATLGGEGRFVAELGGHGNVAAITDALQVELAARGYDAEHPWYFPSIGEYAPRLETAGFEVRTAALFDRPTELDNGEAGLRNWIEMFGDSFFADVTEHERAEILTAVEDSLRKEYFEGGTWTADYRRLRFSAVV